LGCFVYLRPVTASDRLSTHFHSRGRRFHILGSHNTKYVEDITWKICSTPRSICWLAVDGKRQSHSLILKTKSSVLVRSHASVDSGDLSGVNSTTPFCVSNTEWRSLSSYPRSLAVGVSANPSRFDSRNSLLTIHPRFIVIGFSIRWLLSVKTGYDDQLHGNLGLPFSLSLTLIHCIRYRR